MLEVLYEDNHCLAVFKPSRVLTAGDRTGDVSLLEMAREYVRQKYRKPGNVYLGLVHRLDRPVSGVVLFARTSKAAARLAEQFRTGRVVKVYEALVEGDARSLSGELVDWLLKDPQANRVKRVAPGTQGARVARLGVTLLRPGSRASLVVVTPQTGRSHQIRAQLAARGHPICGDRKYGARSGWRGRIALHAARLTFEHPVRHVPITVAAKAPADWDSLAGK
jgi:23S rRNA pseudouridine1911/1915/1917 synthase